MKYFLYETSVRYYSYGGAAGKIIFYKFMTSAIITNTFFQRMAFLSLQTLVHVLIDFFSRLS